MRRGLLVEEPLAPRAMPEPSSTSGSSGAARTARVTVRVPVTTLERFVREARAQGTSPARLMREALLRSAQQRASQARRGGV